MTGESPPTSINGIADLEEADLILEGVYAGSYAPEGDDPELEFVGAGGKWRAE